jgi:hypothetical protein
MCSGELDTVELCLDFVVASCQYAVSREQSIAEVAAIFGTDWIQVCQHTSAYVSMRRRKREQSIRCV